MGRKKEKKSKTKQQKKHQEFAIGRLLIFILGQIGEIILIPIKYILVFFLTTLPIFFTKAIRYTIVALTIARAMSRFLITKIHYIFRIRIALFRLGVLWKLRSIREWWKKRSKKTLHSIPQSQTIFSAPQKRNWTVFFSLPQRRKKIKTSPPTKPAGRGTLFWRVLYFIFGAVAATLFVFLPFQIYQMIKLLPNPKLLTSRDVPVTTKFFDRNGVLLYELFLDENRTPLPLSQIPDIVKQATIAIEDRDFYKHNGFSLKGIIRAARETFINKRVQGGSTITQQLIKSTLLTPEFSFKRKLKEVFLAFWAEQLYTKDEILEMYLNQVPYGGTAWGIESAAQTFFGKSIKDSTLAEAALLAGLPAAPSDYSLYGNDRQKAFDRQKEVLRRMVEDGVITQETAEHALRQPIVIRAPITPIRAPHFVLYVKEYLTRRYGERLVERGGLRVTTTIDSALQEKVQSIVSNHVNALERLTVGNGAALVTNPKTGEILAMVGSKDYFNIKQDGNVNVTTALRQPGSSIKVITYTKALEQGFTAATLLDDSPVSYQIPGQPPYAPVNYDGRFHGPTPLRNALGNSYNIPAVKTLNTIGVGAMIDKAKSMGIDTWEDRGRFGLSLTLGGGEVTMLDMAEAYGTLAYDGIRTDTTPILEIIDYAGNVIQKGPQMKTEQATSREVAWIMSNILSDNAARTQAFGPTSQLVIPGKTVSVKTGTTNDKRDNWTIGYTPSFVATVWVGNNDNSPMNPVLTSGVTGASPIWHDIMVEILKDKPDEVPVKPETVVSVPCYGGKVEFFVKGTEPENGRCRTIPSLTPSPKKT